MLKNRSVGLVIILSIVTCGIYALYWTFVTMKALDEEGGASNMSFVVQFILLFFYVGYILFGINADANINAIKQKKGMPTADNKVLWLVLGLVFPIALIALVQSEINNIVPQAN